MSRLAVIGAKDTIMGFRALGLTLFPVTNAQETMVALKQAFAEDYGAVFVT
jgi:V/A-type H+-transporting ATPase subunit F